MNIIIAGDGEVGFYLDEALVDSNHNITIVDPHEDLLKLVETHADLMTIVGESNSVAVLKKANVAKADLVISVLQSLHLNLRYFCVFVYVHPLERRLPDPQLVQTTCSSLCWKRPWFGWL